MSRKEYVKIVEVEKNENKILTKKAILSKKVDYRMRKKMVNMFDNKESDPDLTIVVGKKEFLCHKIVLGNYPYFKTVKGDRLDLSDIVEQPAVMEALLVYIYKGELSPPKEGKEIGMLKLARTLGMNDVANMIRAWMATYLNVVDACKILEETLQKKHYQVYEILVKIIEKHTRQIFDSRLYLNWSPKNFLHFIEHSDLQISEIELFNMCIEWCELQSKKTGTAKRELFMKVAELIRYPLMSPEEFAEQVEPLKIVSDDLIFETYKYFALPDRERSMIFKNNLRCKPRGMTHFRFKFDASKVGTYVQVLNNGNQIKITSSSSRTIISDKVISRPGIYFWEWNFEKGPATSYSMYGVCDPGNPMINGYMGNHAKGFALYACNGTKYSRSSSKPYTQKISSPAKIGCLLEAHKRPAKLYFLVNGVTKGMAYDTITLPCVPAVTITNSQEIVSINTNAKIPTKYK